MKGAILEAHKHLVARVVLIACPLLGFDDGWILVEMPRILVGVDLVT